MCYRGIGIVVVKKAWEVFRFVCKFENASLGIFFSYLLSIFIYSTFSMSILLILILFLYSRDSNTYLIGLGAVSNSNSNISLLGDQTIIQNGGTF